MKFKVLDTLVQCSLVDFLFCIIAFLFFLFLFLQNKKKTTLFWHVTHVLEIYLMI